MLKLFPYLKNRVPQFSVLFGCRSISILPFLSNVLERLIKQQLSNFLNANKILSDFQFVFCAGHSTTTALIKVTNYVCFDMDKKKLTVLVLLDFSDASNTINYGILLS